MRQIVLDTETTGLNARMGDRVIEIGCIELAGRSLTDRRFHHYLNPEREIDEGAVKVHGLTLEFLSDKPRFAEIVDEFLAFVKGAHLIIHNAAFDVEFLDRELGLLKRGALKSYVSGVIDTLPMARELHPGKRNTLDALCDRYGVDNTGRTLHGALKDASLLADVYLAMTRGQESLIVEEDSPAPGMAGAVRIDASGLAVLRASAEELAEHEKVLGAIDKESKGKTVWRRIESAGKA
jgi:DNA polymerase-3 subunit epsilon